MVLRPVQSGPDPRGGARAEDGDPRRWLSQRGPCTGGVTRPDQLETHEAWGQFPGEYRMLRSGCRCSWIRSSWQSWAAIHGPFLHARRDRLADAGGRNDVNELDFYHWISETSRSGAIWRTSHHCGTSRPGCPGPALPWRPHPQPARCGLDGGRPAGSVPDGRPAEHRDWAAAPGPGGVPEQAFQQLVDGVWMKTTSPLYLGAQKA